MLSRDPLAHSYSGNRSSAKFLADHRPPCNPEMRLGVRELTGLSPWPRWGSVEGRREEEGGPHSHVLCARSDRKPHHGYSKEDLYVRIFVINMVLQNSKRQKGIECSKQVQP